MSGAILPQIFLNVPLSTVLVTHGAGLLFFLSYITPRAMFEQGICGNSAAATAAGPGNPLAYPDSRCQIAVGQIATCVIAREGFDFANNAAGHRRR